MLLADRIEANEKEKQELMKLVEKSQLWNAIENFIKKSPINECGLINKKGTLYYPRGSGPFHIKEVYPYPAGAYPNHKSTFRFRFDVLMECEDEVCEEYCMLDVPVALLHEFDQNAFNEWVTQKNKESHEQNLESARKKIEKIFSRYPELRNI